MDAVVRYDLAAHLPVVAILPYASHQSNSSNSIWYVNMRTIQQRGKDAFDAINNQITFRYGL